MEPTRGAHGARDAQDGATAPAQDETVEPARDAHGGAARAQDDRDGGARAAAYDEARALLVTWLMPTWLLIVLSASASHRTAANSPTKLASRI